MGKSTQRLKRDFQRNQEKRKPRRPVFNAWMGHPDGTTLDVPDRPGFIFIREHQNDSREMQARNRTVLKRFDQPIKAGYLDESPHILDVLALNTTAIPPLTGSETGWDGSPELAVHAGQHDLTGGDTDWIQSKRLLSLRPRPQTTADLTIYVEDGIYPFGSIIKFFEGADTSDMTAHIPSTAGNALYRVVYIDGATNLLAFVNTAEFAADPLISRASDIVALIPVGAIPIAAVYLENGITAITEDEIFDIRILFSPSPGSVASGGGSGVLWENIIIVALSGGDHTTIGAALTAALSGDLILVAPGTYAENLTGKAGVIVRAMGQAQSVVISPASGVPLTLPASGTVTFEQVRLTPPTAEVGVSFPSASTAVFILHDSFVDADAAASIDASTAAATAQLTIRDSVIEGDVDTIAVTELHEVVIQGDLNQSASAGNLTIYGGVIETDFAHITGSTIKLIDLPKIDGTISGTGTITGPYITSTGAVTFPQAVTLSTLTATRVPFAGAGGLLTDDANLTFNSGTGVLDTFALNIGALAALSFSSNTLIVGAGFSDNVQIKPNGSVQAEFDNANSITKFHLYDVDIVDGALQFGGTTRISNAGAATFASVTDAGLTSGRVTFAGASGLLTDSANLEYDSGSGQLRANTTGSGAGLRLGGVGGAQWYDDSGDMRTPDTVIIADDKNLEWGDSPDLFSIHPDVFAGSVIGKLEVDADTGKNTLIDFNPRPSDNTKNAEFRFFRDTNTNGVIRAVFKKGDGTNTDVITLGVKGVNTIFNQDGADIDFFVEGDTLQAAFAVDAGSDSLVFCKSTQTMPNFQSGVGIIFIENANTAPTGNPSGGGFMYATGGAGTWRGSSGTVTTFGPAGPHCGVCGYDFWRANYVNEKWGAVLRICEWCGAEYKEGPASVMDRLTEEELSEVLG